MLRAFAAAHPAGTRQGPRCPLAAPGARFTGLSEASGGNGARQSSTTDAPGLRERAPGLAA
jgi:hypothetical protein